MEECISPVHSIDKLTTRKGHAEIDSKYYTPKVGKNFTHLKGKYAK